jgi:carboxyl-terminal processing protease
MGDPAETSTRQALDFLAGRACTPVSTAPVGTARRAATGDVPHTLLTAARPSTAQREVPGLF